MRAGPSLLLPRVPPSQPADKGRIFEAVLEGRASARRELADLFALRPTTVSELVGQLLEARLLSEASGPASGRGRPANILVANPHRLAAIVFQVASQTLRASAVNLAGQTLAEAAREVPPDSDNAAMIEALRGLRREVSDRLSAGTEICGISFSLSGMLDAAQRSWLFTSRWPNLRNLSLDEALTGTGVPVFVARNLDVELSARLARSAEAAGGTLLLHWGYGIGAAYAVNGEPVTGSEGRFGEIGHWHVAAAGGGLCRCGRTGCLETIAALWSLAPALNARFPGLGTLEAEVARSAADLDLLAEKPVAVALDALVVALANLCRILFPRRVIVSGPFVANAGLWSHFRERFRAEGVMAGVDEPELSADQRSQELELAGAAAPALKAGLARLLAEG